MVLRQELNLLLMIQKVVNALGGKTLLRMKPAHRNDYGSRVTPSDYGNPYLKGSGAVSITFLREVFTRRL
jgi:hypothetical protein